MHSFNNLQGSKGVVQKRKRSSSIGGVSVLFLLLT